MDDWEGSLEEQIGWFGGLEQQEEQQEQHQQLQAIPDLAMLSRGTNNIPSTSGNSGGIDLAPPPPPPPPPPPTPLPTPATHAYLGEATTGSALSRQDLEVGSVVELPILSLPGVVLFPGESLPLRLRDPAYSSLAESLLGGGVGAAGAGRGAGSSSGEGQQASRHLGVVCRFSRSNGTWAVGTTAEIRSGHGGSAGEDTNADGGSGGGGGLAVMARGRHRFRMLEDLGWRRGVRYWKVAICPDHCPVVLRPPIPRAFRDLPGRGVGRRGGGRRANHWAMATPRFAVCANSPVALASRAASLLREQREPLPHGPPAPVGDPAVEARAGGGTRSQGGGDSGSAWDVDVAGVGAGVGVATTAGEASVPRRRKAGGGEGGTVGDDIAGDEEEDEAEDKEAEEEEEEGMPRRGGKLDPTLFSFWLAANLPLDDSARQQLLTLDSVVMRLRLEVEHLEWSRRRSLCCAGCELRVAWARDVFTLPGAEGVVGAYVNPEGVVHQTVTVRDARHVVLAGRPEERHSWFPGYAWTIVYCARCSDHLGWRFTVTRREQQRRRHQQQQRQHPPRASSSYPSSSSPGVTFSSFTSPSSLLPLPLPSRGGGGGGGGGVLESSRPTTRMGGGGIIRAENEREIGPAAFYGLRRAALGEEGP